LRLAGGPGGERRGRPQRKEGDQAQNRSQAWAPFARCDKAHAALTLSESRGKISKPRMERAMRLPGFALAFAVIALAGLAGAAEKDKIELEFDKSADFSSYKSFAWVPFQEELPNRANHLRIQRAAIRELLAKGLTESTPVEADICLEYHARL